jgi:hypothetical protein
MGCINLDKENLNIILLSMNLHAKNIEVSHNNILYTIFFDWSENDGGRLQVGNRNNCLLHFNLVVIHPIKMYNIKNTILFKSKRGSFY